LILQADNGGEVSPFARCVARALAGHHGRVDPRSMTPKEDLRNPLVERWDRYRIALARLVMDACGVQGSPPAQPAHADKMGVRLLGLTIVADWIASNDALYVKPAPLTVGPSAYYQVARGHAREAICALGLQTYGSTAGQPRSLPTWQDSWPGLAPRAIQPVVAQIAASNLEPGLAIIEAPMGVGKTEAAIHLAEAWAAQLGLVGAYIALPTQATSNQMHKRYAEYLKRRGATPLLVHGMSWLMDERAEIPPPRQLDAGSPTQSESQRDAASAWLRNLRRALLAPYAVGTIDQILVAGLAVRFGVLRLLGLSNKVLIVDEVHACDTYMHARLNRVLGWCRILGTPVILLSATLPRKQRAELVQAYLGVEADEEDEDHIAEQAQPPNDPYPLVTIIGAISGSQHRFASGTSLAADDIKEIRLHHCPGGLADDAGRQALADRVLESVRDGGCAAVIVNTVSTAQSIYRLIQSGASPDTEVSLFHARFPAWRRAELEALVITQFGKEEGSRRPPRAVLVATQVVEQSLDLDFDIMFTELAPVDLVLQRAGRLWRHERASRPIATPTLILLEPSADSLDFGGSEKIYSRLLLLRTLGALSSRDAIQLPHDFRPLVEAVYANSTEPCGAIPFTELERASQDDTTNNEKSRTAANHHLIGAPNARQFDYPCQDVLADDAEEGQLGDNFRAQTRLGNDSEGIFLLTRPQDRTAWDELQTNASSKWLLRQLFLTRVSIPKWWFRDQVQLPVELGKIGIMRVLDLTVRSGGNVRVRFDSDLGVYLE